MATSTVENYLKAIHKLQRAAGSTSVGEVARELGVTPGTVTTMMRQLSDQGLVAYEPRRGLALSELGRASAARVIRRHRLVETFLVEVMGLDWAEVHEEAEELEHAVSDRLLGRIDAMLGHPSHDPHGDPIPDESGRFPQREVLPLSEAGAGDYRFARVSDEDPSLLDWLRAKGLAIGERFRVAHPDRAAGLLEIARGDGERLSLALAVAEQVYVESV